LPRSAVFHDNAQLQFVSDSDSQSELVATGIVGRWTPLPSTAVRTAGDCQLQTRRREVDELSLSWTAGRVIALETAGAMNR